MSRANIIPTAAVTAVAVVLLAAGRPALGGPPAVTPAMQQVLTAFGQGQWQQAAHAAAALAVSPYDSEPRAWIIAAAALERLGEPAAAAAAYRAYLTDCQDPAIRAYVQEQLARCQSPSAAAGLGDPPSAAVDDELRAELAAVQEADSVELSEHFEVRTPNAALSAVLAELAEEALLRVMATTGLEAAYPQRVLIEVHATAAEYCDKANRSDHWSGGCFELTVDEQGLPRRVIHLIQHDADGAFDTDILDRVLPHELCHLVLTEWFGASPCPLYLQEGLAVLCEFAEQDDRIILTGTVLATGQEIGIEALMASQEYQPQDLPLFYAQSYSLVSYLHDRLAGGQLAQLLEHVRAGCTLGEALQRTLAIPEAEGFLAELAEAWEDHAIGHAQFLLTLQGLAP